MEYCYYELTKAPDFTLNKYASLSETGPSGVLVQHQAFWRQINQWGKLFGGSIHFIYEYDLHQIEGQRLKLVLRFDAPHAQAKESIIQIMQATVLAPYYEDLRLVGEDCLSDRQYLYQINLLKQERFISSSYNEQEQFYTASEWTMNPDARLYSLLKMQEVLKAGCAYCVNIYPVDYCDRLEAGLTYILPHLRELNSFKVKTRPDAVSSGGRDENAKRALDYYEDLMENISESPHFLVNIQAYGPSEIEAKQLLDAAGSEAIKTGNHILFGEEFGKSLIDGMNQGFVSWGDPAAAENLIFLPHLLTLEELVPFTTFPVLFPGENIEMPKETVPPPQKGLLLGKDTLNHQIFFPWKYLSKHAFLAGMPGSGKTNSMMYLVSEIHKERIPVLVLEPAKKEYRILTTKKGMQDISLFSPCANSMFPLHINPFEFPKGMKLADHINRLLDVFNGTFQLDPPMPMLLTEGIQDCYEELLWLPGMINTGDLEYPTMHMLYEKIEKLLDKYEYAPEVKSNLQSILQVRIGSLLAREMGDIFDVARSTYCPEDWLNNSAVIELAALGTGPSNFLILMLMTLIRESLDIQTYQPEKRGYRPRHVIFLEEAHNLIANSSTQIPGGLDPKVSATAFITKMLAEVRALGEGIVIADQLPTAMAPEVVKNTSLKIGLRLTSQDERELIGSTMSADPVQLEKMGVFLPGTCLVSYEDLQKPFEMRIPEYKGDGSIEDAALIEASITNLTYHDNMYRSAMIMHEKYNERLNILSHHSNQLFSRIKNIRNNWKVHEEEIKQEKTEEPGYIPSPLAKQFEIEKENNQREYNELMASWCRLTLDVLLYMGVTMVRRRKIEEMSDVPQEEKGITVQAHNKWLDLIFPLYKAVQSERAKTKENAIKYSVKVDNMLEENLIRQQKLIQKSWKMS